MPERRKIKSEERKMKREGRRQQKETMDTTNFYLA